MRYYLFLWCLLPTFLFGQKVVQLEKRGNPKTQKFTIGDELTYKLSGDDEWYEASIVDIKPEIGLILFENRLVKVQDIVALRFTNSRNWSKKLSNQLYVFAGGWLFFGLIDRAQIVDDIIINQNQPNTRASWKLILIPVGVAVASAILVRQLFKQRVKKMKHKYRLRLLDLDVSPLRPTP
jgi:hypothetical protein